MSFISNLFNPSPRPPTRVSADECQSMTKRNGGFTLFLIVLFFLYWWFAVLVERIDLSVEFAEKYPILAQIPFALTIREMFTLQVARHLIPVFVGWWLAYEAAVSVVQHLYDLPDSSSGRRFLSRLQSSSSGANSTPLEVKPETLQAGREKSVLLRVGGPGQIKLPATYVGVTEMNDRFCRVLPPGKSTLHAFEYLHSILDLQQQDRFEPKVHLISLDGLPFTASINIVYRLKTGKAPNQQNPYPYDPEAIRTAAYVQTVIDDRGTVIGWEEVPKKIAKRTLRKIVRNYTLDQIFSPKHKGEALYVAIQKEFKHKIRLAFSNMGLEMLEAHVINMELPDKVKKLYLDYWQSQSDTDIMLRKVEGKTKAIEKLETARADAEETMIDAILEGVSKAQQSGNTTNISAIVALRLVEALEGMAIHSPDPKAQTKKYLPTIEQLRRDIYHSTGKSSDEDIWPS